MAVTVPRVLVVADLDFVGSEARWLELLAALGEGGRGLEGVAVQVRAKGRSLLELERLARAAREAFPRGLPLILNGPTSLARSLGYEGVHWPQAELPGTLPPHAGPLLRSAAVHSREALLRAAPLTHYLVVGPVYAPGSKDGEGIGLDRLAAFCRTSPVPVVAIGGIDVARAPRCLEAGAVGVAVVSAVLAAADPLAAARDLLQAVTACPAPR